jgi:hypothetical protein
MQFPEDALRAAWRASTRAASLPQGIPPHASTRQEPLTFQQGTCPAGESVSGSGKKLPAHPTADRRKTTRHRSRILPGSNHLASNQKRWKRGGTVAAPVSGRGLLTAKVVASMPGSP